MKTAIHIGQRSVGDGHPAFIVAEAGINHNGDLDKARLLIDVAAEAGADAVKFQTHFPDRQMLRELPETAHVTGSLYELLERTRLTEEDHWKLLEHARQAGIRFLSTPFSREGADLLHALGVEAFKIGSGEMNNRPLLEYVASFGRPLIVSTGMSTWEELEQTQGYLEGLGVEYALMHCVSAYPAPYEEMNLRSIERMKSAFGVPVGLSDHSPGIYTALAAIPLGANLIEKHFTADRNWPGPDQKASLEPHELRELVKGIRAVEAALGAEKTVTPSERQVRRMARTSVVTVAPVRRGEPFTRANLWVKRPGTGIPADRYGEILGRRAKVDLPPDTLLRWEHVAEG